MDVPRRPRRVQRRAATKRSISITVEVVGPKGTTRSTHGDLGSAKAAIAAAPKGAAIHVDAGGQDGKGQSRQMRAVFDKPADAKRFAAGAVKGL